MILLKKIFKELKMPVFDFKDKPDSNESICTYITFKSWSNTASAENPIMVIANPDNKFTHHTNGMFINPIKRTSFELHNDSEKASYDIVRIDSRFTSLYKWLGENHIKVRLSGILTDEGYCVYKIREQAFLNHSKLSSGDGFLQYMIERLLSSDPPSEEVTDENDENDSDGDGMKLTSIQSITDFIACAGKTLPENIQVWARRNLVVAKSNEVSPEERRHAQRALSTMMSINWKNNYFASIDPVEAKRILDEELYGMEKVKQRIIETIIQINRTHTLPAYGLLIVGPAGKLNSRKSPGKARIQ